MKKFWFLLGGFVLGIIFEYNINLKNIDYRISYYGYAKKGDDVYPIVKLRKKIKGPNRSFHPRDDGIDIEVGNFIMDKNYEFTDEQINEVIRLRYCN